jgi:hypothetical protein
MDTQREPQQADAGTEGIQHGSSGTSDDDMGHLIDRWHALPSWHPAAGTALHEYLGMTWEEFKAWVESRPPVRPMVICEADHIPHLLTDDCKRVIHDC